MRVLAILALTILAAPVAAQDFSIGSEAKSWNLYAEVPARFEAKVVDMLCEIAGDCAPDCGGGARQLGLLRKADGVLVFPNKNSQPLFTGAVVELLPFCGQDVEVDGLMIEDADLAVKNVYLVQTIRRVGDADWVKASNWTKVWQQNHPEAAGKGPWFRRDPRVKAEVAANGFFGLGIERDREIREELGE